MPTKNETTRQQLRTLLSRAARKLPASSSLRREIETVLARRPGRPSLPVDEMIALRDRGVSFTEIGAKLGTSETSVRRAIKNREKTVGK